MSINISECRQDDPLLQLSWTAAVPQRLALDTTGVTATTSVQPPVIAIPSRLTDNIASGHDDSLDPVSDWNFDVLAGAGSVPLEPARPVRFMDALCDQFLEAAAARRLWSR
jgi:hypothetical protein